MCAATASVCSIAHARQVVGGPSEDPEQIVEVANQTPPAPLTLADRPIYQWIQAAKKELNEKYGFSFALEDTLIYQAASGGVDPNDAMVNTLSFFSTWRVFRSENGKNYGGFGFQAETRGDPLNGKMIDLRDDLGTIWSPNDSTSDDYSKIGQLWWGQKLADGRFGYQIGKIDPGSLANGNRFAGSGNTQFFGQPFATNPARSFSDNGIGFQLRGQPTDWIYLHFVMSDSDAISTDNPFKTITGNWLYVGEIGFTPKFEKFGIGNYRFMLYQRDTDDTGEFGWSLSFDQDLSDEYGVFLRYGSNDGDINAIKRILSLGVSNLMPFGRENDQTGVGVSYTHPTSDDFRGEYSAEAYYRLQVTEGFQLSFDTQFIVNPSASDQDVEAVFGLRARLLY